MRVDPISAYRPRSLRATQVAQTQVNQSGATPQNVGAGRAARACNRYRKKLARRRVWVASRSPRAPSYDSIEFSSIDHSPFELGIDDLDDDDLDPLTIEKNNAKRLRKRVREIRRWEKFTKRRKGKLKGCIRYPKKD